MGSVVDKGEVAPVYNIQVAGLHTYFVRNGKGDADVLVHNDSAGPGTDATGYRVKWNIDEVKLLIMVMDYDVGSFWQRYQGYVMASEPGTVWGQKGASAHYTTAAMPGDDVFRGLDTVYVKVPDDWDSEKIATYIVEQSVNPNGEFTGYFASYLMSEGVKFHSPALDRGLKINEGAVRRF